MRLPCFAALAALAAPASAQVAPMPMPQIKLSRPMPALKAPIARKLQVLELAGITVPPAHIQQAITLSVRQPWIDDRTWLGVSRTDNYSPSSNVAVIARNPGVANSYVDLRWPANPAMRHIVDCTIDQDGTDVRFSWSGASGPANAEVTVAGGRAAVVMPAGSTGEVALMGTVGGRALRFSGCEITPVR